MKFIKNFLPFLLLSFIVGCAGFKPLYRDNINDIYILQNFTITSDKNQISKKIKKQLISLFPTKRKTIYILKVGASIDSVGIVSDSTRRISRYKVVTLANIKLYQRKKEFDKLIYSFKEKKIAPYSLVSDNVRSTLASRKKAENITVRLMSESIYKRVIIFIAREKKYDN